MIDYRTAFEANLEKREAVKSSEASGMVADNMTVRLALMDRVHRGEISLQSAQLELSKIKRSAKSNGMVTRAQAFARG